MLNNTCEPSIETRIVHVPLGERRYDIAIGSGILTEIGAIASRFGHAKCVVVTDETVARLYLRRVLDSLRQTGLSASEVVLPAGEATKSYDHLVALCDALLNCEIERGDLVIALGGGVIGDLAGFAASIVKRGVRFIQIPTTLLAQVDSSIGGKTGVNTRHGKNLVGTFHQPVFVLIDVEVLDTLDARQRRAGYAEIAKYGLLGDAAFFAWLETNAESVISGDRAARIFAIERSCKAKAAIVAADEREAGQRALLNLGHTFGHALEAWAGYSATLLHGEAVAIGVTLAFAFSEELGLCLPGASSRVMAHLRSVGLPTAIGDIAMATGGAVPSADALIALMAQDKKTKGGKVSLVLVRAIGDTFVTSDFELGRLERFLVERCRG